MNREYVIGFGLGVLVVLAVLWGWSAWDVYQKGEQTKSTSHDQMMALIDQTQNIKFEMTNMRSELHDLKSRMDANDGKVRDLMDLRPMIDAKIAELKHDLGL